MPAVTVLSSPNGEPMATTHSPTRTLLDAPIFTVGNRLALILSSATSVGLSAPISFALNSRLSGRVTSIVSASSTTCALVITSPSEDRINPEPMPRGRSTGGGASRGARLFRESGCGPLECQRNGAADQKIHHRRQNRAAAGKGCPASSERAPWCGYSPPPARPFRRAWKNRADPQRVTRLARSTAAPRRAPPAEPLKRRLKPLP